MSNSPELWTTSISYRQRLKAPRGGQVLPTRGSEDVSGLLGKIDCGPERDRSRENLPEPAVDWVIDLRWKRGVSRSAGGIATEFRQDAWEELGSLTVYGKDAGTGRWTFLISSDGSANVTELKLAWPYYPGWERNAAVADTGMFERRLEAARALAAGWENGAANAAVEVRQAALRATHLGKLHERFSGEVALRLQAPPSKTFEGRELWDVMLCLGLEWGDMDLFHWLNPSDAGSDTFFSVGTSTEPGYFLPEEVAAGQMMAEDLIFGFSLPRSASLMAVFKGMWAAVNYAQQRLGGTVLTADGSAGNEEQLTEPLKGEVEELRRHGFEPGSEAALRFF